MASSTTTSAPSRRQTLPSSRPITPAPITPRRFGTASNSSAPQESTTVLAVERHGLAVPSAPSRVASTTCFAASSLLRAVERGVLDAVAGQQLAVALQAR